MRISKRSVDTLEPADKRYFVWDDDLAGFGVRVETSGRRTFICRYRADGARRQFTIGKHGVITAEAARAEARRILSSATLGDDLSQARNDERRELSFSELVGVFLEGHGPKLKPKTCKEYESALRKHAIPAVGKLRASAVSTQELNKLHVRLVETPYRANRLMAYIGSVYSWAGKNGYAERGFNPASDVKRYRESPRERYLTSEELDRLGSVLREAETTGLPWTIQAIGENAKHLPDVKKQRTVYSTTVTAVVRLLLLTGCRLGEILTLRWEMVDLERGFLFLPDSKTGTKHVVLNRSAANVLASLPKAGPYVVPGDDPSRPRHDLKKPWQHIRQQAGIEDVHLHDLRHTHASIGAGAGLSLPVIGKLLGHASSQTTQRYAHLADNPVREGAERIGERLQQAIGIDNQAAGTD